jgi:type IV secretory pathway protease TraF
VTATQFASGKPLPLEILEVSAGRPTAIILDQSLPSWLCCGIVARNNIFLMNWRCENSSDSRYFGPLLASTIVGWADPLWIQAHER